MTKGVAGHHKQLEDMHIPEGKNHGGDKTIGVIDRSAIGGFRIQR